MADQDFILTPPPVRVSFEVNPVLNVLDTLMLLTDAEEGLSGHSDWVTQVAAAMQPEQKRNTNLLLHVLKAFDLERSWHSFEEFLDDLAARDPIQLRDEAMGWMTAEEKVKELDLGPLTQEALLDDEALFFELQRRIHTHWHQTQDEPEEPFDEEGYRYWHQMLQNPSTLQATLIYHLRTMWDKWLAEDWQRNQPLIRESVEAFQQMDYEGMTALEALRAVTGRDLSGLWDEKRSKPRELIFVPSAHLGPYVRLVLMSEKVSRVIFRARLPEGTRKSSPALSRSEVLVRLSALADDTRLQILELLTQHQELCAQDIMTLLDLSQSATSRHLRQLTATGFLLERRREVAKCYSLNPDRVEDTLQALRQFLST
ncbi:MAG: metalloregulator ArsR/SmtB family transcription factor [Anaerolineae bacterium]|nr:metalloregulator ArsR/SmtB family transcription factor [Anaerolineae bacterium]